MMGTTDDNDCEHQYRRTPHRISLYRGWRYLRPLLSFSLSLFLSLSLSFSISLSFSQSHVALWTLPGTEHPGRCAPRRSMIPRDAHVSALHARFVLRSSWNGAWRGAARRSAARHEHSTSTARHNTAPSQRISLRIWNAQGNFRRRCFRGRDRGYVIQPTRSLITRIEFVEQASVSSSFRSFVIPFLPA